MNLQWWWADSVMTNGTYDSAKDNSNVSINNTNNRDNDLPNTAWEGGHTVRYRHSGAASCLFADGHVKAMTKGSIKWYKNIYIKDVYQRNRVDQGMEWAPADPF